MDAKPARLSQSTVSEVMMPHMANGVGNVHGGVIMKLIDTAASVVASRHTRGNAVTASIDRLDFHHPVYVSDLVTLRASLNFVGATSMEIGVRVEAENIFTGEVRHTSSAYLTFVSLGENGRPIPVPPLILESEEEERRNREAQARRDVRLLLPKGFNRTRPATALEVL
jgi:uncharacterized protein (TIGR00369 family)